MMSRTIRHSRLASSGRTDRSAIYGFFMLLPIPGEQLPTVDTSGAPLSRMEVSGPANYLREKLLRRSVAGDTHEFVSVPYLNGTRLGGPSGSQAFWLGELTLRTGAVFCKNSTKIKEFLDDGISVRLRRNRRAQDERRLRVETYLLRHWPSVIRRHPSSPWSYLVWAKILRRMVVRKIRLLFMTSRNERR